MKQITILIVDDNFVVRRGLQNLLQLHEDIVVLGEASTGLEAIQWIKASPVDIVLMDIRMPDINGIRATAEIVRIRPDSKVLILTVVEDPIILEQAILVGAKGYLVHGQFTLESLTDAIHSICAGGTIIPSSLASILRNPKVSAHDKANSVDSKILTSREEEILRLIALGKRNHEIAKILCIEQKTVKNHVTSIYSKLRIQSRYEAITYAQKYLI